MRPPGGITGRRRRMAPAELATALVETIGQARAQSREQVMSAYRSFIPVGVGLPARADSAVDVTAAEMVAGHVVLDISCLDRYGAHHQRGRAGPAGSGG